MTVIKNKGIPATPRSKNYPQGTVITVSSGSSSTGGGGVSRLPTYGEVITILKNGLEYIALDANLAISGGLAMYADLGAVNLPSIYAGLSLDEVTITRNSSGALTVIGGGNEGTVTGISLNGTSYSPSSGIITLPAYPTTLPASDVYAWAKANIKPSYTFSEIGSTPTTLAGYGITDAVKSINIGATSYNPASGIVSLPAYPTTLPASDVYAWAKASAKPSYSYTEVGAAASVHTHSYLPLSGGTLTGRLTLYQTSVATDCALVINGPNAGSGIDTFRGLQIHHDAAGSVQIGGYRGTSFDSYFIIKATVSAADDYTEMLRVGNNVFNYKGNTVYHTANDSGLIKQDRGVGCATTNSIAWINNAVDSANMGGLTSATGTFLSFGNAGIGYKAQLLIGKDTFKIRSCYGDTDNTSWSDLALTTSNVASATKLQTARNLWGQSFDGSSNTSGNMTGVGSITASGAITTTGNIVSSGHLTIGSAAINTAAALYVYGEIISTAGLAMYSSDITEKTPLSMRHFSLKQILSMPLINYTWKDKRDHYTHMGTSAQAVKRLMPENVRVVDGKLKMDYALTAFAVAISGAKALFEYQKSTNTRIEHLEKENKELIKELNNLKHGRL